MTRVTDRPIATIAGTMLVPGVSKNMRLYPAALIAKTVERMQARISDPDGLPIVMRTHHEAGDNSQLIVGRITSVATDETGAARYTADLYDTSPGRDIATLVTGNKPALRSVSIHGYWLGPVKRVSYDGQMVQTADDLEVDAVDFTASPGVTGAVLDLGTGQPRESAQARTPISESYEARVATSDDGMEAASSKAQYADPGYQTDKKPRYPLDTPDRIRSAWAYISKDSNASQYTPKQLKRIKDKIRAAMRKIGADVPETVTRWGELREYYPDGPDGKAGVCIDAYNGPVSLTVRACSIDPADLRVIATAAITAACDALQALDPDMDADIDVAGAPAEDTDGDSGKPKKETAPTGAVTGAQLIEETQRSLEHHRAADTAPPATETTPAQQAGGSTTSTEQEPAVSEATTQAADTAAAPTGRTLSDADIQALGAVFSIALKESMPVKAPKPPKAAVETSETAPAPVAESTPKAKTGKKALKENATALQETLRTELLASIATERDKLRAELREELLRENGTPTRRGYRVHENDGADPTIEDLYADRAQILLGDFGKTPVPVAGTGTAPAPTA